MDRQQRRRGRPPKDSIQYATNLAINELLRRQRQELGEQLGKLNLEVEEELRAFCLNCKQPNCRSGDCQAWRAEKRRLVKEKRIPQLHAKISLTYNTRPLPHKKTSPKAK